MPPHLRVDWLVQRAPEEAVAAIERRTVGPRLLPAHSYSRSVPHATISGLTAGAVPQSVAAGGTAAGNA
eukprot:294292-Chlamydomonas_euryale.AAC.1